MGFNVDNILYQRANWQLKFLVPAWFVQMLSLLGLMGIFAYRVAETVEHYEDEEKNGQIPMVEIVWESTNVGFSTLALVCTIVEVAKYATETLTPFAMFASHCIKLTLAAAMLALDIVTYIQNTDRVFSIVGLSIDCLFLAAAISIFVYSLFVFLRLLKYEAYQETENSRNPARGGADDMEMYGNNVSISAKRDAYRDDDEGDTRGFTLQAEVNRRMGEEFGWNSGAGGVDRSGTIVAQGVVSSQKVSPTRVDNIRRSKSYVTERGVIEGDGYAGMESDDEGAKNIRVSDEFLRGERCPDPEDCPDTDPMPPPLVVHRPPPDDGVDDDRKALLGDQ